MSLLKDIETMAPKPNNLKDPSDDERPGIGTNSELNGTRGKIAKRRRAKK